MNFDPTGKIVRFAAIGETKAEFLACESCGAAKQTGTVCRHCALRLIDLALSTDVSTYPQAFPNQDHPAKREMLPTAHRYDHYEVCLSSDGIPIELGRGSMGITYQAKDTHLGCTVALKIINARYLGGPNARERFLREARTAALLRHINIANVFHLGLGEENCFYAMEYIEGETLDARVRREGALPFRLALNILSQAARALRVAHAQHFIHRDIKPMNMMLTSGAHLRDDDLIVKIIDFGLVKAIADDNTNDPAFQNYFAGTPHYASPEQLDFGIVDARSDIYSLGRCLTYMLTGKQPELVSGGTSSATPLAQRALEETKYPSDVPAPVAALCQTMTAVDPALRPRTADELFQNIAACIAAVGLDLQTERRTNHGRGLMLGAIIVLALVIAVAPLSWSTGQKSLEVKSSARVPEALVEAQVMYAQGTEAFRKRTKPDTERAIECYKKAIELFPGFADAHAALASTYYENVGRFGGPTKQIDLAITSAQRAIAINPNAPKGYQALGAIRSFQGQPWEALLQLHRALELNPKATQAMCDFSLLWCCVGDPQFGLPWARAAANIEPSNVQAWHAAAEACVELCADEQAEECYGRCLVIKPAWMSARLGLLRLHLLQGNFARARQDWAGTEAIESGLILPLTLKAQIELFSGNDAEAETIYRQLLTMNRKGYVSYYSGISYLSALGYLRLRAGDQAEGHALLEEAAKLHLDSDGPGEIYDLAAIRAVEGHNDDALSLLRQAISSGWQDYRATQLDPRFEGLREQQGFSKTLDNLALKVSARRKEAEALCSMPIDLAAYPIRPPEGKTLK